MPGNLRRRALLCALAGTFFVHLIACSAASPRVTLLGVEPARTAQRHALLLFVEVVNPSQRELSLSRLEYRVRADSWFESEGQVRLAREIGAGESAVVEIPVPVRRSAATQEGSVPYSLEGKLFVMEDRIERSWKVTARGAIGRSGGQVAPVRVTAVSP